MTLEKIRRQGIADARAGNIAPGCDYGTCGGCGNDTVIDRKTELCEACQAEAW